jgi:hypothetical protein
MRKMYTLYGLVVLVLFGLVQHYGWSFTSYNEAKGIPKSVRNNPGSYRGIYGGVFHK